MDRLASIAAFVRVVEYGGFTAAARHLSLSTTMVSNHVQELEERLGARLLNRTTRKVSLTEIGREYYEHSLHILAELDEADRAAGALQATPRGRLRVHCHPVLARFIAPVVTAYLRDNPEVSVDLRRGDQMIDLLEEERLWTFADIRRVVRRGDARSHASAIPAGADVALAGLERAPTRICCAATLAADGSAAISLTASSASILPWRVGR
jgi:molybdenum-dependent DNA-binding transcriptional regulator ModE